MPAALWAVVSMLASMGAWEGARAVIRSAGSRMLGAGGKAAIEAAGSKLAQHAAGKAISGGLSKVPWLAKHLPTVEKLPSSVVGAAGGMAGLIGGMKASEWTHEILNGGGETMTMDSDNLPAMEEIKRQASLRDALQAYTGANHLDIDRMFGGGVR